MRRRHTSEDVRTSGRTVTPINRKSSDSRNICVNGLSWKALWPFVWIRSSHHILAYQDELEKWNSTDVVVEMMPVSDRGSRFQGEFTIKLYDMTNVKLITYNRIGEDTNYFFLRSHGNACFTH